MSVTCPLVLCLLSALVEVHSQTVPYVSFVGTNLPNHSYVDLTLVGSDLDGSGSVQCHTDRSTCCSGDQGTDCGDWYFPNGRRLPFSSHCDSIYESRGARRVDLRRRYNEHVSGMYHCNIVTNAVNNDGGWETVYVGLYASGGDVTISDGMIFTVDSDLSRESPQFTLTCTSTGGPATTVTWTRDSETVSGGMTVLDDLVTAQYTHTLTVTGRLGGQYQCNVSNNKPSNDTAELIIVADSKILSFHCTSQTDNTVAIVGGVASGVLIFIVTVAVMIMALLKFRCGLPARTPVQEPISSLDVPTSTNEAYKLVTQAGKGGKGEGGVARGKGGEEEYDYVVVSAHPPAQPVASVEGVYQNIP